MSKPNKDTLSITGKTLRGRFAATGLTRNYFSVGIEPFGGRVVGLRIAENEDSTYSLISGEEEIESFTHHDVAVAALDCFIKTIERSDRNHRWSRRALIIGGSLVASIALLSASSPATPTRQELPFQPMPLASGNPYLASPNPAVTIPAAAAAAVEAARPKLPEKLDMAAVKALHSIKFGSGEPVYYVFADPNCGSCRAADPLFEQSGKTYAVIPVAILGDNSALDATKVLCGKSPAESWKAAMIGKPVTLDTADQSKVKVCAQQVIDNMNGFRSMGLQGTPTVISAKGKPVMSDDEPTLRAMISGK